MRCNLLIHQIKYFQSTPVGSQQTGQDIVVSPNRERHLTANKVSKH